MEQEQKYLEEFKEASSFHRLQNTIVLGQTTVYLAASGALIGAFVRAPQISLTLAITLQLAGLLLSFVFYSITDRAAAFSHAARDRAEEVGEKLGFKLYSKKHFVRKSKYLPAISAVKLLYVSGGISWFGSLIKWFFS